MEADLLLALMDEDNTLLEISALTGRLFNESLYKTKCCTSLAAMVSALSSPSTAE